MARSTVCPCQIGGIVTDAGTGGRRQSEARQGKVAGKDARGGLGREILKHLRKAP